MFIRRLSPDQPASGLATRFRRDKDGATAVEFALVAFPFFAVLFAILETALVFLAGQTFETAVADTARMIRTGQAQGASFTVTEFEERVCEAAILLNDCQASLITEVRSYPDIDSIELQPPLHETTKELQIVDRFEPGAGDEVVVVRVFYEWPLIMRTFGLDLSDLPNGKRLLAAGATFRNEPFPD